MPATAANAAGQLARFADRVPNADAPADGTMADRVRRLFTRAELLRQWPSVRVLVSPPSPAADAKLTATARGLAERCRTARGGWFGGGQTELLNEVADQLVQLADRLDAAHSPVGLVAQLDRTLAGWRADPLTAQVVQLDALLGGLPDATPGPAFGRFDTRLRPADGWTPAARAAAGVVWVALDHLAKQTGVAVPWDALCRWADGWFGATGVSGAVRLNEADTPAGVVCEPFPLPGDGGRAVLVLVPPAGVVSRTEPTVGEDGGRFDWPEAESRAGEEPFDTVVEVRANGGVTLSDGPSSEAFAAFHELFALAPADPRWWGDGRWREGRRVSLTPDPVRTAALAGVWLDACSPTDAQAESVCRWAEVCGLSVVRVTGPDSPGVRVRVVFADAPPGTPVSTNRAGFVHAGTVLREAVAEVSLGPAPMGLAELEAAAERLPAGNDLRAAVGGLRAAAEGHYLREAVLQLYTDYWGDTGATARELNPSAAAAVGERLNALLAHAFGLHPFHPANVHELPSGWMTVAAGSRVMTGVVSRVLRPGLQDDQGHLRIPAVVEVD